MARLISSSRALYILEGIDLLAEKIRHASEELRALRDVSAIASPAFGRPKVSGSHNSDSMANRIASIERYESELARNIDRWIRKQREADRLIAALDDPMQMQALHMRYVEGCSVPTIADAMHYSRKNVYVFIHKGLDALDAILEARAQEERKKAGTMSGKYSRNQSEKGGPHGARESVSWYYANPDSREALETGWNTARNESRNEIDNETEDFSS